MPPKDKYTNPELRDQVKKEVQDSDKGGAPGQWSARKAQFMASEYKKRGGDYTTDKSTGQDDSQKNLSKWTEEEWQTKEGSGHAKQADGTEKRYLPKEAWEKMSDGEKEETEQKKVKGGEKGKQFVGNTGQAKEARKEVSESNGTTNGAAAKGKVKSHGQGLAKNGAKGKEDHQNKRDNEEEEDDDAANDENAPPANAKGKASGRGTGRAAKAHANALSKAAATEDAEDGMDEDDAAAGDGSADDDEFDDDGGAPDADDDDEADDAVEDEDDNEAIAGKSAPKGDAEEPDDVIGSDEGASEEEAQAEEEKEESKGAGAKRARGKENGAVPSQKKQKSNSGAAAASKQEGDEGKKGQAKGAKTFGSKHDDATPSAPVGSATRLPKVGQRVSWKALPGWVHGECVEIVKEDKEVEGKRIKGSEGDPRLALRADSGKIAGHKPDACYFDDQ